MQLNLRYSCPCCGYPGLDCAAYRDLPDPPWNNLGIPPYEKTFGLASYAVCSCCGFEFGNDDNPGTGAPESFGEYLETWISSGCVWFNPDLKPLDWNLEQQLSAVGIVCSKKMGS